MPKEIKKHKTVLEAIRSVDIISELLEKHDGHFEHELDLEVIAYGRNYNGKKVGPYVHLLEGEGARSHQAGAPAPAQAPEVRADARRQLPQARALAHAHRGAAGDGRGLQPGADGAARPLRPLHGL